MRLEELRSQIKVLEHLYDHAVPGGEAEKEIREVIAKKHREIAALEQASDPPKGEQ